MIQIPRKVLGQFRSVLRKLGHSTLDAIIVVKASADPQGLRLRAAGSGMAVEYHQAGDFGKGEICFRGELLKACQGSKEDRVTFSAASGKGVAEWVDRIPQSREFDVVAERDSFPAPPARFHTCPPSFVDAMRLATPSCSRQGERYATQCLLLDGANNRIVATDGRQLLVLTGQAFPWKEEILLPVLSAFGLKDVLQGPVQVGKSANQVSLKTGPWTFHCQIEANSRCPRVDQIIPKEEGLKTTLIIDPAEAKFLLDTLPRLPRPSEDEARITLDLDDEVVVRASGPSEQTTDVVLARSTWEGEKMRLCVGRELFARALDLGIHQFSFTGQETPVLGKGDNRLYIWLPLSAKLAVAASANCRRIEASASGPAVVSNGRESHKQESTHSMQGGGSKRNSRTEASAAANGDGEAQDGDIQVRDSGAGTVHVERSRIGNASAVSIMEMAQNLREQARTLAHGLNDLIKTIKSQRRQSRLVETTLSSLRQLQGLVA